MLEFLTKLAIYAVTATRLMPSVLGDSTSLLPYTFSSTRATCSTYTECQSLCHNYQSSSTTINYNYNSGTTTSTQSVYDECQHLLSNLQQANTTTQATTASPSPSPSPTPTPTPQAIQIKLRPADITVLPGDQIYYQLHGYDPNTGRSWIIDNNNVNWRTNTSSIAFMYPGKFQAINPGEFSDAIKAHYNNHTTTASVKIAYPTTTPTPTPTPTPIPTPIPTSSSDPNTDTSYSISSQTTTNTQTSSNTTSSSTTTSSTAQSDNASTETTAPEIYNYEPDRVDTTIEDENFTTRSQDTVAKQITNQTIQLQNRVAERKKIYQRYIQNKTILTTETETQETNAESSNSELSDPSDPIISDNSDSNASQPTKIIDVKAHLTSTSQKVEQCLKDQLSTSDYQQITQNASIDALSQAAKDSAKSCMVIKKAPQISQATSKCLSTKLGSKRFEQLYYDIDQPTHSESKIIQVCNNQPVKINTEYFSQFKQQNHACLKLELGQKRYDEIIGSNSKPTSKEIQLGRKCLNIQSSIANTPVQITAPDKQIECLKLALGEKEYQQIQSGEKTPTSTQINKADKCQYDFKIEEDLIAPVPIEQLPFIPEVSEEEASIQQADSRETVEQDTLVLKGKAEPNTLVDIYIFSDPLIVSTTTDENGEWIYELSYHLEEGEHRAYTLYQHPDKGIVKSQVFNFGVAYARDEAGSTTSLSVAPARSNTQYTYKYLIYASILISAGIIGLIILITHSIYVKTAKQPFSITNKVIKEKASKSSNK